MSYLTAPNSLLQTDSSVRSLGFEALCEVLPVITWVSFLIQSGQILAVQQVKLKPARTEAFDDQLGQRELSSLFYIYCGKNL